MLEKVDLTRKMPKDEYKSRIPELELELGKLQRECKAMGIPVMIMFEGFGASGKGLQIGKLIQSMDPRGFHVYTIKNETEEERMRPFLWRFWTKTPEKGRISVFDGSWYRKVLIDRFEKRTKEKELPEIIHSINSFETQLVQDGCVIIKLFLAIDKKEQKKRFEHLEEQKETAWRVTQGDKERNAQYEVYSGMIEDALFQTDTEYAPWTIIEATDRRYATVKIYTTVLRTLTDAVERKKADELDKKAADRHLDADGSLGEEQRNASESGPEVRQKICEDEFKISVLSKADLTLAYTREEYEKKLKKLQKKIALLHNELYRRRIPVVIGFEGWDAGGKGGAIKRLTSKMDPRGYVVNPTAAPNDIEKAHHYLWRFWRAMPKDGHVAIFDRTWYGRVMVERIEGFCTEAEWKRAYQEINDMEKSLSDAGAIVLKFWMQIDKDEQERRFQERENNPEKRWKITEEDWRNREKWDQYEVAVNEMLLRTSTEYAPWIIVEGNNKYYARIKVLESVIQAIETRVRGKKEKN